ncbi:MAG: NADH-quinone oxidoreductase subunit NuoG [Actinomycetota bacterium]|nr:NADH-quinone oxidoreductase subunit NuoG [Actinomycetota bacterium]
MPRPEHKTIQLTIDGREVRAIESTMLVDAAKYGDVEIPYFCYHTKLGNPVGACRMCLVEIEGIPKLQTSCSTPVKDGMVVHTQTDRVRQAQHAVVEFLLVNHPLDCPVCDKGGECPLQDITFGWGLGRSRFIEPKRHFVKPLALSPLVAIDRERCILCYRCVRFSQEIAEDYQLVFAERGAHSFVSTHDGHPYVAPFSGNIIELCPVGALTSQPYRFRARPWEIEGAASICTMCPSQCNVELTVRDERVLRVLSRENPDVDDGWLCDKGRFAYQSFHVDERVTAPMVRDGGQLREVSWERALEVAAGLGRHRGHVGALVGGQATNEEGFLLGRLMREALNSDDLDSRAGATVPLELARALAAPSLQATVADLEFAHTVLVLGCEPLDDAPILDLRIRKGVRRRGVKLAIASARPSALDRNAQLVLRFEPGSETHFLTAVASALEGGGWTSHTEQLPDLVNLLRGGGEDVVIVWGERLPTDALAPVLRIARALGLADREGAGLLEIPAGANSRGLREAGVLPGAGAGYASLEAGRCAAEMAQAAADGEITAFYLFQTDPVRDHADRALWERALHRAGLVVAHASVLTDGIREHANVVFPAESYAEKDGTVVHPDGRVQRLRAAVARPRQVRAGWSVICDIADRLGLDMRVQNATMAWRQLSNAVPFYAGLTLEEIAGQGVHWPAREQAATMPAGGMPDSAMTEGGLSDDPTLRGSTPESTPGPGNEPPEPIDEAPPGTTELDSPFHPLRLGRYRPIWAAPEVEISPALHFTIAEQLIELSPGDAGRMGISHGDTVEVVGRNGAPAGEDAPRVRAQAAVRTGVAEGVAFLADGLRADSANVLTEPWIMVDTS